MTYAPNDLDIQSRLKQLLDPAATSALGIALEDAKRLALASAPPPPSAVDELLKHMRQREAVDPSRLLAAQLGTTGIADALKTTGLVQDAKRLVEFDDARRLALTTTMGGYDGLIRSLDFLTDHGDAARIAAVKATSFAELFRMPEVDEIQRTWQSALGGTALARGLLSNDIEAAKFRAILDGLSTPWLALEGAKTSMAAMLDIQVLGEAVRDFPFKPDIADALRAGLGDWRDAITALDVAWTDPAVRLALYSDRGFDRNLTDFTPLAFHQGLALAGLENETAEADYDALCDPDYVRGQAAFKRLQRLEVEIRAFLMHVMGRAFGPEWVRRQTPGDMYDRWVAKKEIAEKITGQDLPPIEYADFTDYKQIIERNDNWGTVFKSIFGRQEDVRESFQRLFPLRLATMHARPLTLEDQMLLSVETRRILVAVRRALA